MAGTKKIVSQRLTTFIFGCLALLLVVCIIIFPAQAFNSSLQGLTVWWKLVFPALLPFLIVTEIVRGLGILHGIGALLEPMLRLLFRLPGVGGWAIAVGFTAGTPAGAAAVGTMRRNKLISRDEAERLLTVSHVLSPVFLITVVGVGFLHDARSGFLLALLHYGSAISIGLWQRFFRHTPPAEAAFSRRKPLDEAYAQSGLVSRSIDACRDAQLRDGRAFGKLLGDSVTQAVQQLMAVGGLMMMFSVVIHAVSLIKLPSIIGSALSAAGLAAPQASEALLSAMLPGVFEAHLGAYSLAQSTAIAGSWQYALLSGLFAWGGLSTHAQVKSFTIGTDIRYSSFLKARLLHAAVSVACTAVLWKPLYAFIGSPQLPVWASFTPTEAAIASGRSLQDISLWPLLSPVMLWFSGILLTMLIVSVFVAFAFRNDHRITKE